MDRMEQEKQDIIFRPLCLVMMGIVNVRLIESNSDNPYPIYFAHLERIEDARWMKFPTRYFGLLLCADFEVKIRLLQLLTDWLVDKGILYFLAWGPGCERAHDIFDQQIVYRNLDEEIDPFIMTTWHDNQSLRETLYFTVFWANLIEEHKAKSDEYSTVVVTFGNTEWKAEAERLLSDIEALKYE